MGLSAHQEEIIAQLYREMYRKLVVYADTPQGQTPKELPTMCRL